MSRFADAVRARRPDLRVTPVANPRSVCVDVDLLVTATASTVPLVHGEWLAPGVHVTVVGADSPTKVELSAGCLRGADRIVVDSRALARVHGDLARAQSTRDDVIELGEVLSGATPGRKHAREITVCKLIGVGVQDLAAAEVTVDLLREDAPVRARPPAGAQDLRKEELS
jgi:ornithine cyclodeaminase